MLRREPVIARKFEALIKEAGLNQARLVKCVNKKYDTDENRFSIAESTISDWKAGEPLDFIKVKAICECISEAYKKFLEKEVGWQDIFKQITGNPVRRKVRNKIEVAQSSTEQPPTTKSSGTMQQPIPTSRIDTALHNIAILLDRLATLPVTSQTTQFDLFRYFMKPLYSTFEQLHNDYLDSFNRYWMTITETELPLNEDHPIFNEIRVDSVFSRHLRSRLQHQNAKWFGNLKDMVQLDCRNFITAVGNYILYTVREKWVLFSSIELPDPFDSDWFKASGGPGERSNIPRKLLLHFLMVGFKDATNEEKRREVALKIIENIIEILQSLFDDVSKAYAKLESDVIRSADPDLSQPGESTRIRD